jgi:hypothetical protein
MIDIPVRGADVDGAAVRGPDVSGDSVRDADVGQAWPRAGRG